MTVADLPACLALWTGMPGITLFPATDSPEGLARYLNRNPGLSVVAPWNGKLAGAALEGRATSPKALPLPRIPQMLLQKRERPLRVNLVPPREILDLGAFR